jgi:hypothetical protein
MVWGTGSQTRSGCHYGPGRIFSFFNSVIVFYLGFCQFSSDQGEGERQYRMSTGDPAKSGGTSSSKGLAVFIPGYIISLMALVIILAAINLIVYLPGWHIFILPGPSLILGLIINPLLLFSVLLLTLQISFIANPDGAIAPSMIVGFGLMIGMPVGLATGFFDINSWSFVIWYIGATVVAWIVVLAVNRTLTRQNIVLSEKGG